jgi:hypothetical protein
MADRKISDLTALTTPAAGDYLPIVDISEAAAASKNKRITIEELFRGVPLGTAAAPSIAIEGNENTGVFSPGANQLAVATNGTGRLFVDASGRVGIGSTSPASALHVQGTAEVRSALTAALSFYNATEYYGFLGNSSGAFVINAGGTADTLVLQTNGTERLRITSAGLVGIGTTSPAEKLHISGNAQIGAADANSAYIELGKGATGNRAAYIDFVGDTTYTDYGLRITRGAVGANANTAFLHRGTGSLILQASDAGAVQFDTSSNERARIDSSGRLLVGTSSSSGQNASLQVVSSECAQFHKGSADTAPATLNFSKSRNTSYGSFTIVQAGDRLGSIAFRGDDGTDYATRAAEIKAEVDGTPGANVMPGRIVLSTTAAGDASPTERMRIKSAGTINFSNVSTYADNTAALAGGLVAGDVYRKSDGTLMITY